MGGQIDKVKFKNYEKQLDKFRNAALPNFEPSQGVLKTRKYKTTGQREIKC
jgi:hypothetical protein